VSAPIVLAPDAVARPWGGHGLPHLGLSAGEIGEGGETVGEWWLPTETFPLLIKIIDARENLSIQLHPDDELARSVGLENGKTEAWYVLGVDPGARILLGLNDGVDPHAFLDRAERGEDISPLLRSIEPAVGDVVFVPPGTMHAICAGVVVLEAQQVSDTTYRVFDWNREPKRQLHLTEARRAIRTDARAGNPDGGPSLEKDGLIHRSRLSCTEFEIHDLRAENPGRMTVEERPEMWFCPNGAARLATAKGEVLLSAGRFALLASDSGAVTVTPTESPFSAVRMFEP